LIILDYRIPPRADFQRCAAHNKNIGKEDWILSCASDGILD
jgi:hypothetical protein